MKEQVQKVNVFDSDQLISLFNCIFLEQYNTQLIGGSDEPLYTPENKSTPAEVIFTHDYFSSALHEIAHWCIAGEPRRQKMDYGYWYAPDGRTKKEQSLFEQVEVKPQAMEWVFAKSCGHKFHLSADNLNSELGVSHNFRRAVYEQVGAYCISGLSSRAGKFSETLADFYQQPSPLDFEKYSLSEID